MKILIICPKLPWPILTGGEQAVFNMVKHLQHHCDIHFIYPTTTVTIDSKFKDFWNSVKFYPYIKNKTFKLFISRVALRIFNNSRLNNKNLNWLQSSSNYFMPDFINFVNRIVCAIEPDIIQTEFYNYQDLVFALPDNICKIFIQHEIHYIVNRQALLRDQTTEFEKFLYKKIKAEEIAAMNNYNAVFTLTENDKTELIKNGVLTSIYSSPAGIEEPQKRNACIFFNKLIFVGGSGHTPNLEGVTWFVNNVWSIITQKHPEVTFNIIGKWDDELIKKLTNKHHNINFKGFVSNLQDEYNGAIAIVPILSGSGMRMKIVDAVNFGSPFVSTTIGAEGLEYKDATDCFISDDPKQFAEKVNMLIENEHLRKLFYDNSVKTRDKYYSMEALSDIRFNLYKKVLEKA